MNGLRAVHRQPNDKAVNGTETVHYGIHVGLNLPPVIEQLQSIQVNREKQRITYWMSINDYYCVIQGIIGY